MTQRIFIYVGVLVVGVAIGILTGQFAIGPSSNVGVSTGDSIPVTLPYRAGAFGFGLEISPNKPVVGDNKFTLVLRNADGKPVAGASISAFVEMPAMGAMPAMRAQAETTEQNPGTYQGAFEIPMAGAWPLTINVKKTGMTAVVFSFDMATGRTGLKLSSGAVKTGGTTEPISQANEVAPLGTINVDAYRRQLIGVKTAKVVRQPLYRTLRAYGQVRYDETRMSDVSLKYDTWIGELKADFVGAKVNKGQVLFTIFSPDLFTAQQEYLKIMNRPSSSSKTLLAAAQQRLAFWGMSPEQIASLETRGTAEDYVPILSEQSGYVVSKSVVAGSGARAGTSLMRIADLSSLWIEADIYEADFSLIKVGTPAIIHLSYGHESDLEGRVDYVYPVLQHDSRTGHVRFSFPNPGETLRPGMYAEVQFRVPLGQQIAVPVDAVLVSGDKRVVFVDIGQGRLAPRYVKTGRQTDGLVEILSGLEEGDQIVTSGNFLIASESKLRAGIKQW